MIRTQEHSLIEYFALVKPYVSSQLIDAESWCDIEAIAVTYQVKLLTFLALNVAWELRQPRRIFCFVSVQQR
jgi:hypothetical protein